MKKITALILAVLMAFSIFSGCDELGGILDETQGSEYIAAESRETSNEQTASMDENGEYNTKDEVAAYIAQYGKLPSNYITKKEAEALGWSGGGLDDYAYGKSIGGDHFGNHEGLLPEEDGRKYTECDIDTMNKSKRGAKRIIFSNDGLIFYTDDHYESFTQLYP